MVETRTVKESLTAQSEIIHGDCLEVMRGMEADSVDLICCDPPYQLSSITRHRTDPMGVNGRDGKGNPHCYIQAKKGFMSKTWDVLPSVEIWRECLRVLKPGAFAFIMCTPRQDSFLEMLLRIREAGFSIGQTFMSWCYATGFPKCHSVGKAIDKAAGKEREVVGRKSDPRFDYAFPKSSRPYQGTTNHDWSEDAKSENMANLTAPATPEAAMFEGWCPASSLKPCFEPIIVAQKPLSEKTYAAQALKSLEDPSVAPGCLNLEAGRIPYQSEGDKTNALPGSLPGAHSGFESKSFALKSRAHLTSEERQNPQGRCAPNLLVEDDVLNDGRVIRSGKGEPNYEITQADGNCYGWSKNEARYKRGVHYGDTGSFSRYFSLDQWFAERIKQLPESMQRTFPFLVVAKPSRREKEAGCNNLPEKVTSCLEGNKDGTLNKRTKHEPTRCHNTNPCVKPIKLMSYLLTIGSREGDLVLDPFLGSGTTGVAAKVLGRRFLGIEREAEYVAIAEARIAAVKASSARASRQTEIQHEKDTGAEALRLEATA